MAKKIRAYDILGSIALVRFPNDFKSSDKKKFASKIMEENKAVKTVLEKKGKIKGRLRKQEMKYVSGEKTKEVLYRENGCEFRFNIDTTYFSPRLSNERKEVALMIKRDENVLVMFGGVAPFGIVIAKNSKCKKVVSVELNREAAKYAKLNVERNNLKNRVEVVQGDVRKFVGKWEKMHSRVRGINDSPKTSSRRSEKENVKGKFLSSVSNELKRNRSQDIKFDVIVMARPQLKETFLKEAFKVSKKGTRIFYYDFCSIDEVDKIVEKVKSEAKKAGKKIRILKKKVAGEIVPYKFRVRVDFQVI